MSACTRCLYLLLTLSRSSFAFYTAQSPWSGLPIASDCQDGRAWWEKPRQSRARVLRAPSPYRHQATSLYFSENDNDDTNPVLTAIDAALELLSRPTPGFPDLVVGVPLALVVVALTASLLQGLVTAALFIGLATLGRQVIVDRDETEEGTDDAADSLKIDLFALSAAVLVGAILVPSSSGLIEWVPAITGLGLAVGAVLALTKPSLDEDRSTDDRLMDLWDQEFFNNKNDNDKR